MRVGAFIHHRQRSSYYNRTVGEQECLIARNLEDGTEAWKVTEPTKWHDMLSGTGPRSTPTIHDGKIYSFSNGLACVEASNGSVN